MSSRPMWNNPQNSLREPEKSGSCFYPRCSVVGTISDQKQIFSFEINENKMYDKKTEDCVKDIINRLVAVTEWELMLATSKLIKDKLLLKNVLDILIDIFSEAVRESFEASSSNKIFEEESKILSARLTKLSLIKSIEVLENTKDMLEKNANMNKIKAYLHNKAFHEGRQSFVFFSSLPSHSQFHEEGYQLI